ncbi:GDP-L-fucose synthase family protein [Candidatus Pelagibacter sp.]|uniref:GDP-L-fucose synthase family protein n=1 Tax=Candidatus Pelagibacter sp. TaxID=2024849 RepID=UPI003F82A95F
MININSKVFIAGHNGMLGSSIFRTLKKKGYKKIITVDKKKLDLRNQIAVKKFIKINKPDAVIIAAAKVGGIKANIKYPANFISDNLQIQTNLISSSHINNVKKLILFGSSCIYPKHLKKPIKESQIMTGLLEETNESYAVAKIAGIKMIESFNKQYNTNYICLMPCNLFGPNDNYDSQNSHFLPALIKKIYLASKVKKKDKVVKLWGTGKPLREVLYVDEVANACEFFLRKKTKKSLINIGSNVEMSIKNYANLVKKKIDPRVLIRFDNDKNLDGVMRKKLNLTLARSYGWKSKMNFSKVLDEIIRDFKNSHI